MPNEFARELDDLKAYIKDGFDSVHNKIQSLERHVTGGSEPEKSIIIRLRDTENDVRALKRTHSKIQNFLIATGIGAIISVGGAIKSALSSIQ
jgi:hypothetical protein